MDTASTPPTPSAAPSTATLIRLTGRDALSLLHRLSTQALDDLAPAEARMTMFCDFRGRLLHRAAVARTRDGAVWVARDDGPGAELVAFLDRHVFRDDVRFEDMIGDRAVRLSLGAGGAARTLAERDGMPERFQVEAGAAMVVAPTSAAPAPSEAERIRAGWPRHGHEIEVSFNPFEIGRAHELHLSKGCYTGQEALLRMVTYGGVRRALAHLAGPGAPPSAPADLTHDGVRAGRVTSVTPVRDGWIGLAAVRVEALTASGLSIDGAPVASADALPATRPVGLPHATHPRQDSEEDTA